MQFSGTQLNIKRSFYAQTGNCALLLNAYVDSVSGVYKFGLSGNSGNLEIILSGGKMYNAGNHIHSYQAYAPFSVEINSTDLSYNIEKDTIPLIVGQSKTTGYFDYAYLSRENTGINMVFDLFVDGDNEPIYTLQERGYLRTSGQNSVTGYFLNRGNFPIRVFNSNAATDIDFTFNPITGLFNTNQSGFFSFDADYDNIDFSNSMLTTLNTNFNDISVQFKIVDLRAYTLYVLLQETLDLTFDTGTTAQTLVLYNNYSGNTLADFPTHLQIYMKYVSGSGAFASSEFGDDIPFFTTGYGNFRKYGYLTGNYYLQTGNSNLTGVVVVSGTKFAWATGATTGYFSGVGLGFGTGIGYTGLAYGGFSGSVTGFISDGSGTFLFNTTATGVPQYAVSVNYTGYVNATGYIDISRMARNDYFYITSLTDPLIKGFQFNNETGLVYYLSGQTNVHKVNGYVQGGLIYLQSTVSGATANGFPINFGSCPFGTFTGSDFLTGGVNIGNTGIPLVPIGTYTGTISTIATGSGNYVSPFSGVQDGTFFYTRTFTGTWDVLTGLDESSLVSFKSQGFYNSNTISGSGFLPANSYFILKVEQLEDSNTTDAVDLYISGDLVANTLIKRIIR